VFARVYADARERANAETELPLRALPKSAPMSWTRLPHVPACLSAGGTGTVHGARAMERIEF
jgi:hypothetical protein